MATVDIRDAEQWCNNWRTLYKELMGITEDSEVFRGFRIPIADIQALATATGAHAVRGYMAIKDLDNPVPEFLLVPVIQPEGAPPDGPGEDVVYDEVAGRSAIYNFTRPCPVQCDTASPLYKLLARKEKQE